MNINQKVTSTIIILGIILLQGCMADMRTSIIKKEGITEVNSQKGKSILETAWEKHGFENLKNHESYEFMGEDIWKGMMGKMGKPWPEAESKIAFKYAIGTFDSQSNFKNGKRKGVQAGLQSWKYYEKEPNGELTFKAYNKRIGFGLAAYQYFFEMLDRLKRVPIIAYAGEKEFNGQKYDLVFATWHKPEPHKQHDQYILWINQKTKMLDYAVYSLRDNYLKFPGSAAFYGSIKFDDYQKIDGIMVPHKQTVFMNAPAKKDTKHIHQLSVSGFRFDGFDLSELYPDSELEKLADSKESLDN